MRPRRILLVLILTASLGASGLILASNMGLMFRADFSLPGTDYWLALPYRTNLATAQDVCQTIGPEASLVSYYDTDTETRVDWTCPGGSNFALQPGVGITVQVSAPTTAVFLGAHDPTLEVPTGGFVHTNRDYYLAIPYHTTATVASDLCAEIPNAGLISRFDPVLGRTRDWTCPFGDNFVVQVGEAIRVVVTEPSAGIVPQHY